SAIVGTESGVGNALTCSLGTRLITMSTVVVRYLGLLVFPGALHMERSVPPASSIWSPDVLCSLAVLGGVTVAVAAARRRAWPLAFGWAWFLLALLPVANILPLSTFMAEHWLYVPSMGPCIAVGWALARLGERTTRSALVVLMMVLVV